MDIKMMSNSLRQFRPKDSGDRRMYNPDRDIAYLSPVLMQLTTNSFYEDGAAREDFEKLSEEDQEAFAELMVAIGTWCTGFMRGERDFGTSLKDVGLDKFKPKLMRLWLLHYGHTMLSAFYHGVRDVMVKGVEEDPMPYDKIFDSAEEIRRQLRGTDE